MSTKSEINISTIWDIFNVGIVPEIPVRKLISKSWWGVGWKEGEGIFFLISLGEATDFLFHFSGGKSMLTAIAIVNSNPAIFLVPKGIKNLDNLARQTKALIISLYLIPKRSFGGSFLPKQTTYPAHSFTRSRQSNYQYSPHSLNFSSRHTNQCILLFTSSEVLLERNWKSKHESTGKTSFKKLMCVSSADIKTEDRIFLESSNF